MEKEVKSNKRIEWEIYPVTDTELTTVRIDIQTVQASADILLHILGTTKFRMQHYEDAHGRVRIGYGVGNPDSLIGMSEDESFSAWLAVVKSKQAALKKQLPLAYITQTQFDALFSLFMATGNWKTVTSSNGIKYDILSAITANDWKTVADMIADGKPDLAVTGSRLLEARVLQLGDYSGIKPREWLRTEGIQYTRNMYISGKFTDAQKRQAEIAYYRETGLFLPNMNEARKRAIMKLLNH